MLTTNLITFEVSFINSTETIILNTSLQSLNDFCNFLKSGDKKILNKVLEYDRIAKKFKRCNKERFLKCIDHQTELYLLITKK